ncbi:MAG TPA: sulfite exporter TauE/SafE family protein [Thermodesulfobacteriota bacterium]|nr:sulfite exporter TauE/SafE family protein [Thermodesulfobacteriota bacterium]
MLDLLAPFLVGLIGSVHCLGMCGPLVVAYSLQLRPAAPPAAIAVSTSAVSHHVVFHAGRVFVYSLLGALAAGFANLPVLSQLRGFITLGGGIAMVLFGLSLLKIIRLPAASGSPGLSRILPRLVMSKGLSSRWALGMGAGFLPCMLSWAMIAKAATTQNAVAGFLTAFSFGVGTVPALFLAGLSASILTLKVRILGERIAAISVIVMGVILVVKGVRYLV